MLTKETPLKGLMEYSIIKADELHKKHLYISYEPV